MIEDKEEHITLLCYQETKLQKEIFNESVIIAQLSGYYKIFKAQDTTSLK